MQGKGSRGRAGRLGNAKQARAPVQDMEFQDAYAWQNRSGRLGKAWRVIAGSLRKARRGRARLLDNVR
jgi:hypothetical protein